MTAEPPRSPFGLPVADVAATLAAEAAELIHRWVSQPPRRRYHWVVRHDADSPRVVAACGVVIGLRERSYTVSAEKPIAACRACRKAVRP